MFESSQETDGNRLRPYQLTGGKYALWFDCAALGANVQSAVGNYLCGGSRIAPAHGGCLDERSREIVSDLAKKRGVFIPVTAY